MPGRTRPTAPHPYELLPAVPAFTLASETLTDGKPVPAEQLNTGAGGANNSPQLSWSGAPAETRGYVVTCFDPDAPTGCGWWHWIVAGLTADTTSLAAGVGAEGADLLPKDAYHVRNDFCDDGYGGAAPPAGDGPHRYLFAVHALDVDTLDLDATDSAAYASFVTVQHTIARAVLTATAER